MSEAQEGLREHFYRVRQFSLKLCENLEPEDYVVQSMPDASPTKWHLAHTTWFFETFVLAKADPNYQAFDPIYNYLFNSYYVQVGERYARPQRGVLSRPTVAQVMDYRRAIDFAMNELLQKHDQLSTELRSLIVLGLHHEQQHQELMVTDIKHVFSHHPLGVTFTEQRTSLQEGESAVAPPLRWVSFDEGCYEIGIKPQETSSTFFYDNEGPHHRRWLESFALASRPTTNAEYEEFIADGGYDTPTLWLSEGWDWVQSKARKAPFYWKAEGDAWQQYTLHGHRSPDPNEPVTHLSYFEADAYARWAGAVLPTEFQWEVAAREAAQTGCFVDDLVCHPQARYGANDNPRVLHKMFGDVWEWTSSAYAPYPGYQPAAGAVGEYNGKFMINQMVLRGGSCATSQDHIRASYRNFFPTHAQWQFSGLRLARALR